MLVQLSDPHMRLGPDDEGAGAALEAAVAAVLEIDPAPDAVIVTGDLANTPTEAEYERVRRLLEPLPMPVHVLPGNHDDRALMGGETQYVTEVGHLRLVVCDSTIPGRIEGRLDLDWLAEQIAPEQPTIVAMHHPPIVTGVPALDDYTLPPQVRSALGQLLRRHPHVERVIAGHFHRAAFGSVGGCPVVACPSVNLQAKLAFGSDEFITVREPPAYAIHAQVDGTLVSHLQPVAS
jgi:3',5'-cyclic-AMP phosphodiesterase